MKAHTPHGVGFFVPETPVFAVISMCTIAKSYKDCCTYYNYYYYYWLHEAISVPPIGASVGIGLV